MKKKRQIISVMKREMTQILPTFKIHQENILKNFGIKYGLPKTDKEEIENMISPVTAEEIEFLKFPESKVQKPECFTSKFYLGYREVIMPVIHKFFQITAKEKILNQLVL